MCGAVCLRILGDVYVGPQAGLTGGWPGRFLESAHSSWGSLHDWSSSLWMSTEKWVLARCKISKEEAVVREKRGLASCRHPPESTSLVWDEWLQEHKFCKAGAGLSSRCGLPRSNWANLIAHWPRHNWINLHNCQKTNPAKALLTTSQAESNWTQWGMGLHGWEQMREGRTPFSSSK